MIITGTMPPTIIWRIWSNGVDVWIKNKKPLKQYVTLLNKTRLKTVTQAVT